MSDDDLRALQQRRLAALAGAIAATPFQRDRLRDAGMAPQDLRSFDALGALAPVTKSDLLAAGLDATAARPADHRSVRSKATSGSSGEPFRFLVDRHALDRGNAVRAEICERMTAPPGPLVELLDAPVDRPMARGRRAGATPGIDRRVIGYRLPVPDQVDLVTRIAPAVLRGNRSHLLLIAEELARRAGAVPSLGLVISSSEMLGDDDRRRLQDVFDAPVRDVYGLAEVEAVAWENAQGAGYEVVAPRVIVEVLSDGSPVAPGEVGEIVVTGLDNHVMPFVRYATGDLARLPDDPTGPTAGSTTLRLGHVEGRRADSLVRADGTLVSPWQAGTSVFWGRPEIAGACRQWQIDQHEDRTVTVSVVPVNAELPTGVIRDIEHFVREAVGAPVTVRAVERVENDPNGKFRAVRSAARSIPSREPPTARRGDDQSDGSSPRRTRNDSMP